MNALFDAHHSSADEDSFIFDEIAQALRDKGYIILPQALPVEVLQALLAYYQSIDEAEFKAAGIGREQQHQENISIRSDEIYWLDKQHSAIQAYFSWMENLRQGLNRRLFLGLFDYECHYAHFAAGSFYKTHLDAFRGQRNRVVTSVLYLNPEWSAADGGELILYSEDGSERLETLLPYFGTMIVFLSEEFPHEVAISHKSRHSLTGWFRVNNSLSDHIDPSR